MPECRISVVELLVVIGTALAAILPLVLWGWRYERRLARRLALNQQIREMEYAIEEEGLPDEERERRQQYRVERAAIAREARRRLGLSEEA